MARMNSWVRAVVVGVLLICAAWVSHSEQVFLLDLSLSPWVIYRNEETIEALKPKASMHSSISVCGAAPATFVAQCQQLGLEVYKLVGGKHPSTPGDGGTSGDPKDRLLAFRRRDAGNERGSPRVARRWIG
jgi:hypothetical protein